MGIMQMFPDEKSAETWFEQVRWPNSGERCCPKCGSADTWEKPNRKPLPFRCRKCKKFFSVRHGSAMERSKIPLHKWAIAIYLNATSLKGVSSMKLHRDLGITQKSAWFMAHRLREAFGTDASLFEGPVEVDETYMGGRERNKHEHKKLKAGRGTIGKTPVVGARDRKTNRVGAKVAEDTRKPTLHAFVKDHANERAKVYTDDAAAYQSLSFDHESVNHGAGEYVRGDAHTNGIESFWATLKRAHKGTFHKMSPKHLQRYVNEFAGRHNIRDCDTIDQMMVMVAGMVGKRLMYRDLISE